MRKHEVTSEHNQEESVSPTEETTPAASFKRPAMSHRCRRWLAGSTAVVAALAAALVALPAAQAGAATALTKVTKNTGTIPTAGSPKVAATAKIAVIASAVDPANGDVAESNGNQVFLVVNATAEPATDFGIGTSGTLTKGDAYLLAGKGGAGWPTPLVDGTKAVTSDIGIPSLVAFDGNGNLVMAGKSTGRTYVSTVPVTTGSYYGFTSMTAGGLYFLAGNSVPGKTVPAPGITLPTALTLVSINAGGGLAIGGVQNVVLGTTTALFYLNFTSSSQTPYGVTAAAGHSTQLAGGGTTTCHSGAQTAAVTGGLPIVGPRLYSDTAGNLYVSNSNGTCTWVLPKAAGNLTVDGATTAVTVGTAYKFAGDGVEPFTTPPTLGTPVVTTSIASIDGLTEDLAGNLVLTLNASTATRTTINGVYVVANSTGTYYTQSMTAGDVYLIAGGSHQLLGAFTLPTTPGVDSNGNLFFTDPGPHILYELTGGPTGPALPATTTTVTSSTSGNSVFGQSVTFTATVTPTSTTPPTGTVTFKDGSTTLGTGTLATVSGVKKATFATSTLGVATHPITAVYGGDVNNAPSTSVVTTQTVSKAATSTAVGSSVNPSKVGQTVTLTATVTVTAPGAGVATGTVTFKAGSTTIGTVALATHSGQDTASFTTSALSTGTQSITAVYGGATDFTTSTSTVLHQTVEPLPATTTTVTSSTSGNSVFGQSVTFTAIVTPTSTTPPTGTVTFKDGSTTLGTGTLATVSGVKKATFTTSTLGVATHSITAVYGGDGNNAPSTSVATTQTVNKANTTTSLISSVNPSKIGQSVTFTATVTVTAPGGGVPTGQVTFKKGPTVLGHGTLSTSGGHDTATFATTNLPVGTDAITAVYATTTDFAASTSSPVNQTVEPLPATTTTVTSSTSGNSVFGQSVTFTAIVTPTSTTPPTGTVTFKDGSTTLGTGTLATVSGVKKATFTTSTLGVATHSITAVYGGDGNNAPSTSVATTQTVNKANTTTTVTSSTSGNSVFGQSVTFTATVSVTAPGAGTPSGTVTFKDGSTTLGTGTLTTVSGAKTATFTTSALTVGSHPVTAAYGGATDFAGSTSIALTQAVATAATTTSLNSSANPAKQGHSVTFTATVSVTAPGAGTPSGTVTFKDGSTTLGTGALMLVSGHMTATYATSTLTVGGHQITAVYGGSADFAVSPSSALTQTVSTVPGAPIGVTATAGLAAAVVTWTAPSTTGGLPVTGYTVTSSPGAKTCTWTSGPLSCTVSNLTPGTAYTFTVTATNATGTSAPSTASTPVTPTAPTPPVVTGATRQQGASSSTTTGTAAASLSGSTPSTPAISASGKGIGALTVAQYKANPTSGSVSGGTGVYYDLELATGSTFSSVSLTICTLGGGNALDWWNGSAWLAFSNQSFSSATGCATATVSGSTSPTLAQLTGTPIAAAVSSTPPPPVTVTNAYYEVASDGGIFAFGGAPFYGSMGGKPLNKPIVGIATTPTGGGYYEVASDGGIFAFGNAPFYGSMGGKPLNQPVVGITVTPTGGGYYEVASDGGLFAFGNAAFHGSMGGKPLNKPIVGIAVTPTGTGYYEVASDGGIFAFGTAKFYGSMGGKPLNQPVVGITTTATGGGYYEVASDGGIFAFGTAPFYGSMGGKPLNKPIVGITTTLTGGGYYEVASDGGIFAFGTATFQGSMGGKPLNAPVVGIATDTVVS